MRRVLLAGLIVLALLLPSGLQALTWTPINLWVAMCSIAAFVPIVRHMPRLKWPSALLASLPIAISPYPNWLWASNDEGWHFRVGYKLSHFGEYAVELIGFYLVTLLLLLGLALLVKKPR
jgi:hypothetical protein